VTALVDQFYADVQAHGRPALGHIQPDQAAEIASGAACRAGRTGWLRRLLGQQPAQLFFGDDFKNAHDLLHTAHGAGNGGGPVSLALCHATHQVGGAALGHDLEGAREQVLGIHQGGRTLPVISTSLERWASVVLPSTASSLTTERTFSTRDTICSTCWRASRRWALRR
jgi:hypothetical protein